MACVFMYILFFENQEYLWRFLYYFLKVEPERIEVKKNKKPNWITHHHNFFNNSEVFFLKFCWKNGPKKNFRLCWFFIFCAQIHDRIQPSLFSIWNSQETALKNILNKYFHVYLRFFVFSISTSEQRCFISILHNSLCEKGNISFHQRIFNFDWTDRILRCCESCFMFDICTPFFLFL